MTSVAEWDEDLCQFTSGWVRREGQTVVAADNRDLAEVTNTGTPNALSFRKAAQAFMMLVPGSGQRWKTAFKTPMIASGGTANELHR